MAARPIRAKRERIMSSKEDRIETMQLLLRTLDDLEPMSREDNTVKPIQTYLIEVGFKPLPDHEEQMEFADIPTSLSLPEKTVDRIRDVAGKILFASPEFKELVENLDAGVHSSE